MEAEDPAMAKPPLKCPKCGTALHEEESEGLCPLCLLGLGLDGQNASPDENPAEPGQAPDHRRSASVEPSAVNHERVGEYLGGYRIVGRLGRGGMGVVYRAWEEELRRTVALKVPSAGLLGEPAFSNLIGRFKLEARAAASLSHPNICPIYTMGEEQGVHYFAMEYVRGETLAQHLREYGPLEPMRALEIASQVTSALAAAHGVGLLHRDIKPANIMLARPRGSAPGTGTPSVASQAAVATPSGRLGAEADDVRVMDFGLAE